MITRDPQFLHLRRYIRIRSHVCSIRKEQFDRTEIGVCRVGRVQTPQVLFIVENILGSRCIYAALLQIIQKLKHGLAVRCPAVLRYVQASHKLPHCALWLHCQSMEAAGSRLDIIFHNSLPFPIKLSKVIISYLNNTPEYS